MFLIKKKIKKHLILYKKMKKIDFLYKKMKKYLFLYQKIIFFDIKKLFLNKKLK